jgi:hypothetical protein
VSSQQMAEVENALIPEFQQNMTVINYADEIAALFPRVVKRAGALRILNADEEAPLPVQKYLAEASQCYIYGRHLACLIVCRSAIEFSLRERLGRDDLELEELITLGKRQLHWTLGSTLDDATCVRKAANRAVHERPPEDEVCREMFERTRGVLRELYSVREDLLS